MKTVYVVIISSVVSIVAVFSILIVNDIMVYNHNQQVMAEYNKRVAEINQEFLDAMNKPSDYYSYEDKTDIENYWDRRKVDAQIESNKALLSTFLNPQEGDNDPAPIDLSKELGPFPPKCPEGYYSIKMEHHPKDFNRDGIVCKTGLATNTNYADNY